MFAYFVVFLALFVYCNAFIVMVLWTGCVVSLYGTVYNSMSCARFERERERIGLLVAVVLSVVNYNC